LSQALEEREELVVGSIATGLSIERRNGVENSCFSSRSASR
jgi:hypothetical protein